MNEVNRGEWWKRQGPSPHCHCRSISVSSRSRSARSLRSLTPASGGYVWGWQTKWVSYEWRDEEMVRETRIRREACEWDASCLVCYSLSLLHSIIIHSKHPYHIFNLFFLIYFIFFLYFYIFLILLFLNLISIYFIYYIFISYDHYYLLVLLFFI